MQIQSAIEKVIRARENSDRSVIRYNVDATAPLELPKSHFDWSIVSYIENRLLTDADAPSEIDKSIVELPLNADFVPSPQLINFWTRGLNSYIDEASDSQADDEDRFILDRDVERLRLTFSEKFRDIIVKFARMKSYQQTTFRLSVSGRFSVTFMSHVADRFLIRQDEHSEFFHMLFDELRQWLQKGRTFSGRWGNLRVDEAGDFIFDLSRPKKTTTKGFTASDEA